MPGRQYGVVPYQRQGKKIKVYLITRRQSGHWGVPKGWAEPDMSRKAVAQMEAFEEAGLLGRVNTEQSFQYSLKRRGKTARLKLFPMEVTRSLPTWPEQQQRQRKKVSLDKALRLVACPELRRCLTQFQQQIAAVA